MNAIARTRKRAKTMTNVRTKTAIVSLVTVVEAMVKKIKCVEGKPLKNKEKNTLYTETGCMSSRNLPVIVYIDKSVISQEPSSIKSAVSRKITRGI